MKNVSDIQELLDRYWEGETTLEEERRLKAFFSAEPVPEQYRHEAALFRALLAEQTVQLPAGRDLHIAPRPAYRLGWWAAAASVALLLSAGLWWINRQPADAGAPIVRTAPQHAPALPHPAVEAPETPSIAQAVPEPEPRKRHVNRAPVKRKKNAESFTSTPGVDTYEDPEKALEEIKAVLALVSNKINKGKKEIGKGLQEVEAVDILFKKKKDISG